MTIVTVSAASPCLARGVFFAFSGLAGQAALKRPATLDPLTWLAESREHAVTLVYTSEVLGPIQAAADGIAEAVPRINLTDEYLQRAEAFARVRAAEAAYRLAGIWRVALK